MSSSVDAETTALTDVPPERFVEAVWQGQVKYDVSVGCHRKPRVGKHFSFQLSTAPAGVSQRNDKLVRSGTGGDVSEYVTRRGHHDFPPDIHAGFITFLRAVQDESPVRRYRPGPSIRATIIWLRFRTPSLR